MALTWTIWISMLGAIGVYLTGPGNPARCRWIALTTAVAGCAAALAGAVQLGVGSELATLVRLPWVRVLGIEFHLAADGVSVVLVLLTGIAAVAGVLFSWNIEERANEFFALYLMRITGVYGVFLSFD
ncbi:MAG: NADH-quinone oxidoreductase subunit M, partial [Verrucomicrobiales bacterium]|nr:NADH-quinone oxidoreductase subunit M [Verrucomicrobiales bacterium]